MRMAARFKGRGGRDCVNKSTWLSQWALGMFLFGWWEVVRCGRVRVVEGGSVKECNAGSLGPPRVYKSALRLCQFIRTWLCFAMVIMASCAAAGTRSSGNAWKGEVGNNRRKRTRKGGGEIWDERQCPQSTCFDRIPPLRHRTDQEAEGTRC